ncbi:hypothetical protein [Haliea sp.]|jgi:hypothetical protein|uniref:hypothetical protein n=1 Tax=Haliea sp. TaxID=1932666 RepID=UPI00257E1700|nr:hypothetical protein [Haliea sp.]|tara:strand:+ start:41818 stop:42261 length:444 start_codon:yes stop_codon:yes gene_type:complete
MKVIKKQQGFSAIDISIGVAIIVSALVIAAPIISGFFSSVSGGKIELQVSGLSSAADCYRSITRSYAGMDNDELLATDCVTDDGLFLNDFGGTNSVAPLSSNPATGYVITVNGITSDGLGERKVREHQEKGNNASYSGGTLTIEKTL